MTSTFSLKQGETRTSHGPIPHPLKRSKQIKTQQHRQQQKQNKTKTQNKTNKKKGKRKKKKTNSNKNRWSWSLISGYTCQSKLFLTFEKTTDWCINHLKPGYWFHGLLWLPWLWWSLSQVCCRDFLSLVSFKLVKSGVMYEFYSSIALNWLSLEFIKSNLL